MLCQIAPADAYRRVELDAYIFGGNPAQLTRICLAEGISALNRSLFFDSKDDRDARTNALMKAISCVQALKLGVDPNQPLGEALLTVYGDACNRLALAMRDFDREAIGSIRQDFLDMEQAFAAAQG